MLERIIDFLALCRKDYVIVKAGHVGYNVEVI